MTANVKTRWPTFTTKVKAKLITSVQGAAKAANGLMKLQHAEQ